MAHADASGRLADLKLIGVEPHLSRIQTATSALARGLGRDEGHRSRVRHPHGAPPAPCVTRTALLHVEVTAADLLPLK
jgi:hypothetical protein